MKKRHFAYDVNVGRIDSNAGVDAYVFAGPVSGPDFQSEVVDQQFKVMGLVTQVLNRSVLSPSTNDRKPCGNSAGPATNYWPVLNMSSN